MHRPQPRSTLFPYTTLFRSWRYASQGLFSTSVLSIALGMLLASAVAIAGRQLSVLRALVVVEAMVAAVFVLRSEEQTSELQSHHELVCRLLLEKKNKDKILPRL